jgi:hypothetical protein
MSKGRYFAGLGLITLLSGISPAYPQQAGPNESSPSQSAVYVRVIARAEGEEACYPKDQVGIEADHEYDKNGTLRKIFKPNDNLTSGTEGEPVSKLEQILSDQEPKEIRGNKDQNNPKRRDRYVPISSNHHIDSRRPEKRGTNYGRPELIKMIYQAAEAVCGDIYGCQLVIHDLSRKNGGRVRIHRSHRTGLDADIGHIHYDTTKDRYYGKFVPVDKNEESLSANWDLIRAMADAAGADEKGRRMEVIFWDRKYIRAMREFVTSFYGEEQWNEYGPLLKPEPGHRDHLHFRIRPTNYSEDRNT